MRYLRLLSLCIIALFFTICTRAKSNNIDINLAGLDSCIAERNEINAGYEKHIAALKQQLGYAKKDYSKRRKLLYDIFEAYSAYQFDSAFAYVKVCYNEAVDNNDTHAETLLLIKKAQLLTYGGFYNTAEEILNKINFNTLPEDLRYDYAIAAYWTYVFWTAFTMDNEFTERMDSLRDHYLDLAIKYDKQGSADWYYLLGEKAYFSDEPPIKAIGYYKEALKRNNHYGRLYSQTAFAIARGYNLLHNNKLYGEYLLLSSISDQRASVKENAALQDLAMYVFNLDHDNATLAHHYLLVAMEDATFFNNKLRKLEISNRLPPIVTAYQKQLETQRHEQLLFVMAVIALAIGVFVLYILSRRRNAQLHLSQKLLEHKNAQLHAANVQMKETNGELSRLNVLLKEANHKREEYLRLFVDICASTMDRITSYRNLVKLKIKANQTKDLLRTVNSDRIINQDMNKFYMQFDKAFLGLYPNFVKEFANLLTPESKVELNKDGSMTTGLRIFAFIRLGVTESSEIATLLSYSPHTIYNYRSSIKGQAKDKEHFEEDVKNLCKPS